MSKPERGTAGFDDAEHHLKHLHRIAHQLGHLLAGDDGVRRQSIGTRLMLAGAAQLVCSAVLH